jgi:hypothetical protein
MSPDDKRRHLEGVRSEEAATSYEHPTRSRMVKTGEIANAGTYKCTNCGNEITFKDEGHVPPCSVCANTEWERE